MSLTLKEIPSSNCGPRPPGAVVDILLIHYTGMPSAAAALEKLCDPASKVSAHYLIDERGAGFALVGEDMRAWHAGISSWAGESDVNSRSIGIELANPGHENGYRDFPEAQMASLIGLCRDIIARHAIPAHRVLGHSDVAPMRKADPGERFDWARLARQGIGLYPPDGLDAGVAQAPDRAAFLEGLSAFGYPVRETADTQAVITAFHRHFNPAGLGGPVTAGDGARLMWLNAAVGGGPERA